MKIRHSQNLSLVANGIAGSQTSTRIHQVTLAVLRKEMQSWNMIKQLREMRAWSEPLHPLIALGLPSSHFRLCPPIAGQGAQRCGIMMSHFAYTLS